MLPSLVVFLAAWPLPWNAAKSQDSAAGRPALAQAPPDISRLCQTVFPAPWKSLRLFCTEEWHFPESPVASLDIIIVKHFSLHATTCYIHAVIECEWQPSRSGAAVHHNGGGSRACPQLPVQTWFTLHCSVAPSHTSRYVLHVVLMQVHRAFRCLSLYVPCFSLELHVWEKIISATLPDKFPSCV